MLDEDLKHLLQSLIEAQKETDWQLKETDWQLKETDRQLKETLSNDLYGQLSQMVKNAEMRRRVLVGPPRRGIEPAGDKT